MPRIFVSYSRKDKDFVTQFTKEIRSVYDDDPLWYDQNLKVGQKFWNEILKQIQQCQLFIFIYSPDSLVSPYCQGELQEANRLRKVIIPIKICDVTAPSEKKSLRYYNSLEKIQYVDATAGWNDHKFREVQRAINGAPPPKTTEPRSPTPTPFPGGGCFYMSFALTVTLSLILVFLASSTFIISIFNPTFNTTINNIFNNIFYPDRATETAQAIANLGTTSAPTDEPAPLTAAVNTPQESVTSSAIIPGCTPVQFGRTPIAASLDGPAEQDCYSFEGREGDRLQIRTVVGDSPLVLVKTVHLSDGTEICSAPTWWDEMPCTLTKSAVYSLLIRDQQGDRVNVGPYNVFVQRLNIGVGCTSLDNVTTVTTASINLRAEADCYTFTGEANGSAKINVITPQGSALTLRKSVFQPNGDDLCNPPTRWTEFPCPLASSGIHSLVIRDDIGTNTGEYYVTVRVFPPQTSP